MYNSIDNSQRHSNSDEQILYNHLLECVKVETPSELIERFRSLFIAGVGYPDREVAAAVERITASKQAEHEFKFILNRCCHILINRWQMQTQQHGAISELIALFEGNRTRNGLYSLPMRGVRRLHELVRLFTQSEQFLTLHRLVRVMNQPSESNSSPETKPLGSLISQYPYLYEHCLLSEGSTYEHQQTVRQLQSSRQKQFEINLSQYVTYQVRRSQQARQASPAPAGRIIQTVSNPTLLSDRELYVALKHFVGKVEGCHTYRDLSQSFLTHSSQTRTYGTFKKELYDYLIPSIDSAYGKRQFNERLYKQLTNILPQSDSQKFSDFLLVRTCSQLLNFLVVETPQRPNHFVLIDLISNIGPTLTTGLLLKIVLLCRKVKPYLEKRFAILFNHYESSTRDSVHWLVKGLENVNIALSTNFGAVDLSFIR
ncbi:hypothetical protein [Microcoleus sp. FACHB-672]|uniref:hypothetical protein n=1 Tax=Microcoleus sp. FACHB-672 TaxID=2692825 RepID=UPI0016887564|nr:hypothetical protein [Microcoleus sp. FACHB-672]MBD2040958.1 hypothetical protein [Microcoleus sp. FACHB-672]